MNAFIKFNRGIFQLPIPVRLWLMLLMAVNLVVPVIYLQRSEARIVLLTFLASFLLMVLITRISGFTRLWCLDPFGNRVQLDLSSAGFGRCRALRKG
jgi:hypothetical protein